MANVQNNLAGGITPYTPGANGHRTKGIGNHHNFQAHSIEDLPEDYLPAEDSYYDFEPEDVNKENLSIAEMSGKKLDWFRKVCAAVL